MRVLWSIERLNDLLNVSAPTIQGLFPFCQKVVPLINRSHAGNRAGLMVENLIGDVRRNAQSGHSRNDRASSIMNSPTSDPAQFVKGRLFLSETLKALSTRGAKDVRFARTRFDHHPGRLR